MQGKTVVVTGATGGIGAVTALALAAQGARIVLVARDAGRGAAMLARLQSANPGVRHALHLADLGLVMHQHAVAQEILAAEPCIDVLINNAGAAFGGVARTAEGHARSFALNHLSYFVLSLHLLPALRAAPAARIVNTASRAHRNAPTLPRGFGLDSLQLDGWRGYALSKLENIWFTRVLARRLAGSPITVNALHPGFVATGFGDGAGWPLRPLVGVLKRIVARTPGQGADTMTWLACSPEVAGHSGGYWHDRAAGALSVAAADDAQAERLWELSAQLTGLGLALPA
jgi:NAD(P)-dependent dehydrogenase (short-subunit alcohol dehydrogenase family)